MAVLETSTLTGLSPLSRVSAAAIHSKNALRVPPVRWNLEASSKKLSNALRPLSQPSRTRTSVSSKRKRSASMRASVSEPTVERRRARRSWAKFTNRKKPSGVKFSRGILNFFSPTVKVGA